MAKPSDGGREVKSLTLPLSERSRSNTKVSPQHSNPRMKFSSQADAEDESLDSLLTAYSQLSNLFNQIAELVVQACKLWSTKIIESQEIECFTHQLSDMQSSLQPWITRFQQAFSSNFGQSCNQLQQPLIAETVSPWSEEKHDAAVIHAEPELDSLISPSPLVSWRGGDKIETGRQLFLLTPLPTSKTLSSKHPGSYRSFSKKVSNMNDPCRILSLPPSFIISGISHDPLVEKPEEKSEREESPFVAVQEKSKSVVRMDKYGFPVKVTEQSKFGVEGKEKFMSVIGAETFEHCVSSRQVSNHNITDHSAYLMTPLMKMSPPKTCKLLEPIPDPFHKQNNCIHKSKPIETCNDPSTSKTSSGQVPDSLAPRLELPGMELCHRPKVRMKEIEASLDWFLSPPRTCLVMETPNEKLRDNPKGIEVSISEKDVKSKHTAYVGDKEVYEGQTTKHSYIQGLSSANFTSLDCTPLWKDINDTEQKGKQAGETTLRRELWTKFEAVSRFDSLLKDESKGFLNRLEEVSCEETSLKPRGLRL